MRIALSSDHAGFPLKQALVETIQSAGHTVLDLGTNNMDPVDYPDFAEKAGRAIQDGRADRAVVVCGSGVGASIAANKLKGIYACLCHDTYSAHQGVEHDKMNMLCLGGRIIGEELAKEVVKSFLGASFCDEERHRRRTDKIKKLEELG